MAPMTDVIDADLKQEAERTQRDAADPAACVWVSASAGTGKTKALTDRVLSLLLTGTAPSRILCLTFTRAAAAEMANRVNTRLAEWARLEEATLIGQLRALAGTNPDRERISLARRLFAEVLEAPGGLRIATIHGFCESILKRFPVEAGLAPHFEVVDERTSRELLATARDQVLARARQGDPDHPDNASLSASLACIAERANEAQFGELMAALARDHGRLTDLLARKNGLDGVVASIAAALGLSSGDTEASIRTSACTDGAFDHFGLTGICKELAKGTATDQKRARQIAAFIEAAAEHRLDLLDAHRGAFLTQKDEPLARMVPKALRNHPNAEDILAGEARRLLGVLARIKAARLLDGTKAVLALGSALLDAYARLKDSRAALDYDDLILQTRALLARPGMASWVLFKLDEGLDHILVDEAQDTSPDQWAVIAALTEEFFSGESARGGLRTVFAVGDAKQSIYSFQGADPEAFATMREHFRSRAEGARIPWRPLALDVSFRSTEPVLATVDSVFSNVPASEGVVENDRGMQHRPARTGHAGRVELWPLAQAPDAAQPIAWDPPTKIARTASSSAFLATAIAETIGHWIDTQEPLESRGRPISAGDVMVLVRQRTGFMDQLVRALKLRQVPVAGADRMVLTEQLVVQDLLALARFLLLPEDDLTLAGLLKSPLIGLDEEQLFAVAHGRPGTLWASLRTRASMEPEGPFAAAAARLSAWLARTDFVRPFELFAHVLYADGGRERLLARLGAEADDPLGEFLALALSYERSAVPSLQDFVAWIEAGQAEIKRDLESPVRDEVRVMTVHGAKGLQAPIVFLPDTVATPGDRERLIWIDGTDGAKLPLWVPRVDDDDPVSAAARAARVARAAREYPRLLYVAMTRAEDRLTIAGCAPGKSSAVANWYDMVRDGLPQGAREAAFQAEGFDGPKRVIEARQVADPKPDERMAGTTTAMSAEAGPSWLHLPPPPETAMPRPLTPSRFAPEADGAETEPPSVSPLAAGGDRFRRGIAVHRLLQLLPNLPETARLAKARTLAMDVGFSDSDAQQLAAEAMSVIAHPSLAALFAPGSLAEVPFAGRLGEDGPEIVGRLDRLAVTEKEVIVADYKTNRPVPRDAGAVPPIYLRQMALYRAALARAFPGRTVRAVLVYTDGPKAIELPADVLDEIISRVSAAHSAHGSFA
jgi:ATP-dependent helicase/nuclease subunit A